MTVYGLDLGKCTKPSGRRWSIGCSWTSPPVTPGAELLSVVENAGQPAGAVGLGVGATVRGRRAVALRVRGRRHT